MQKKNEKKYLLDWIFLQTGAILLILYAGLYPYSAYSEETLQEKAVRLEAENRRLTAELAFREGENAALRKELIETLDKYSTQAGRLKRMEMGVAGTIETLEPVYIGAREMELAADLQQCITAMRKLSAELILFTDDLSKRLPELMTDQVEIARLRLRLNTVRDRALDLAKLSEPPKAENRSTSFRILETNAKTGLAVLNGGIRDGVREGMILTSADVTLKVIAVRNFVSAAVAVSGAFEKLAVGSEAKVSGSEEKTTGF